MRLLIVEDEEALADGLKFNFEQEGYEVVVAGDGPTALQSFSESPEGIDLVILDLMLPGMSGYEVCTAMRRINSHLPILVLSARTLSADKAHAFSCGSDQYVTKPFALPELLSRVRRLLETRQSEPTVSHSTTNTVENDTEQASQYSFGNVCVDFRKFEIKVDDKVSALTTMEMQLLRYFIENDSAVLSRSQILEDVWGQSAEISTRTIDNFVMRLRKLVETNPGRPRHILSVRGTGYRFVANP